MLPLYAARIEDLGHGDLVKIDCAACHHVALLTPKALLRGGLSPAAKVLELKDGSGARCARKERAVVSIRWGGAWAREEAHLSWSSSAFASFRSGVSKPSVNQP